MPPPCEFNTECLPTALDGGASEKWAARPNGGTKPRHPFPQPTCMIPLPAISIISHNAYGAVTGGHSGFIGGVEWQTSLLARWLAQQGYRVSMLTWREEGPEEQLVDGIRLITVCRQDAGLPGIRFFHPKWTGLVRAMRRADADVYYQNSAECVTGQAAAWCRRNGKAFVFSAASDADCVPNLPELKTFRERLLYRHGVKCAGKIVVQTRWQHRQMREAFGVESEVIPMPCPGPDEGEYQPPTFQAQRVLWVGRVCRVKRPDRLLDLAEACPGVTFDLAGPIFDDSYSSGIRRRAEALPNVTVHGPVPRVRINDFYRRATVLCCTSEYEGFPNVFLEAWSHGLPVVTTFDPDGVVAGGELGIVVKDMNDMKNGLAGLLVDAERYAHLSQNARQYYWDHHRLDAVMPRFERIFREVSAGKRHCPTPRPTA